MNHLEKRNRLVNKINILKENIKNVDFMTRLQLKDEILELEKEIGAIEIKNDSEDCKICCN